MFLFGDPHGPGERKVLGALRKEVQSVTKVIAKKHAVGQGLFIVKSPSICNRRDEILAHNIEPVLIEIVFLKG